MGVTGVVPEAGAAAGVAPAADIAGGTPAALTVRRYQKDSRMCLLTLAYRNSIILLSR
jgi:hypothetical protein